jgi:hypothetical protein
MAQAVEVIRVSAVPVQKVLLSMLRPKGMSHPKAGKKK